MVFFSGLVMSISPGKLGELIKPYFVKHINNEPISKTIPIVLAERITDFAALVILALMGISFYSQSLWLLVLTGVFLGIIIFSLSQINILIRIVNFLGKKVQFLQKFQSGIRETLVGISSLIKGKNLLLMLILSAISWFFECFALHLLLVEFDQAFPLLQSVFIYAFSTIVGALFFLPAGLGVTEGSLTYLITHEGISLNIGVLITFLIRIATLWFAVVIGLITMLFFRKRYKMGDSFHSTVNEN